MGDAGTTAGVGTPEPALFGGCVDLSTIRHANPDVLSMEELVAEAQRLGKRQNKRSTHPSLTAWVWKAWEKEQRTLLGTRLCAAHQHWSALVTARIAARQSRDCTACVAAGHTTQLSATCLLWGLLCSAADPTPSCCMCSAAARVF